VSTIKTVGDQRLIKNKESGGVKRQTEEAVGSSTIIIERLSSTHLRREAFRGFVKYLCLLSGIFSAAICLGGQTWDASSDFNRQSNEAGPWTYGWQDASGKHFTRYNSPGTTPDGLDCWWADHGVVAGGLVANTRSDLYVAPSGFRFPPHWLALHPGPQTQRAALRWTAPLSTGLWLEARFTGLHQATTTDVHIQHNGKEIFAGNIRGPAELSHQTLLKVEANDTIEIMVGNGGDGYSFDYTGVQMSLATTAVGEGTGLLVGVVRSIDGPLANCLISLRANEKTLTTRTDNEGRYRLMIPTGVWHVRFEAARHTPYEAEVSVVDGGEQDCSVRLDRGVDFSYAFSCPHRMSASWPGAGDKTLLDAFPDYLRISWTYHRLTETPLSAGPIPSADHFIEIRPSVGGERFTNHRWTRPDGGVPMLEDNYTTEGASVCFKCIGGRDAMIAKVFATNSSDVPTVIVVRCTGRDKEEALNWFEPDAPGDTLVALGHSQNSQVSLLVSGPPSPLREQRMVSLFFRLQPGETRSGWILRPYDLSPDSLAQWRHRDWQAAFDEAKTEWSARLAKVMGIQLPDKGVEQAVYAAMADLLSTQEPASNGIVTQTAGSEIYRFSNAGDCGAGVVALAQCGLLDEAMEAFKTQFFTAQPDGNWSGGSFPDFVSFSGFKAWVAMEFYRLNHDRAFLEKLYPYMLADSQYHEKLRSQSRREENGKPIRGYGLIQPTTQDCGMEDKTGKGVFIPQNTWTVYADKITLETARLLGRQGDLAGIADRYQKSYQDLMACIEGGAIDESGYRWIPCSPKQTNSCFWGSLNLVTPCELVPFNHPLINGTMQKMNSKIGLGGLTKHTGYSVEGMWVAVNVDNMGMTHLFRGELDRFFSLLYAALNHVTPLYTSCEERGESAGATTPGGDLEDIWTEAAIARAIRYSLVMERDQTLMIARAIPREWLASGKLIKVKDAPSHFGKVSYQIGYDAAAGKITGRLEVPKEYPPEEVRIYLRVPADWSVRAIDPGSGATLTQEEPLVESGDTCPVLIWKQAAGTLNFSVGVVKNDADPIR
jgi:hypothetical protein